MFKNIRILFGNFHYSRTYGISYQVGIYVSRKDLYSRIGIGLDFSQSEDYGRIRGNFLYLHFGRWEKRISFTKERGREYS